MTLESGDRLFLDITPSHVTLQAVSFDNLSKDGDTDGREDCDTVVLYGRDVAVLLDALARPGPADIAGRAPGSSSLSVSLTGDELWLETDDNAVLLTEPERQLLHDAIESRAWRMFA